MKAGLVAVAVSLLFAAPLAAQVDYSIYFWPAPGGNPDKTTANGQAMERQFAIVYNVGQTSGTHPYKLLLRAFAPDGSIACETTAVVAPWQGRNSMKKVAWFEARYSDAVGGRKVRPGKYLLRAYLTEQIPSGDRAQDMELPNNQYPREPPQYVPVTFDVRPGAEEIRCALPAVIPAPEMLPPGFVIPRR